MRGSPNRQTVSTTARWNLGQSSPGFSPGAQKQKLTNRRTGQGSNLVTLKRNLAKAEEHLSQVCDPGLRASLIQGILLLREQMIRTVGGDPSGIDHAPIPDISTGYTFVNYAQFQSDTSSDFTSTAQLQPSVDQQPISPFAQFVLFGTLRQKISKVPTPQDGATPGGSLKFYDRGSNSNVVRNLDNPTGHTFPSGTPGRFDGMRVEYDSRMAGKKGSGSYIQGYTIPDSQRKKPLGRGILTSLITARNWHGKIKGT
jgi:hypothetical protein